MKIRDLTVPELEKLRQLCNFTPDEMDCFNLKAKDKTNIQISMEMNISTAQVSNLTRRISNKIKKVEKWKEC